MNPRGFGCSNYKPILKGINKEIADLQKQLEEKKKEKGELKTLKEKLLALKDAWCELNEIFYSPYIEVSNESCDCYPFDKPFDEIDVIEWVNKFIEKLEDMGI